MPYLKEDDQVFFDANLQQLLEEINTPGDLNFIICTLTRKLARKLGDNYAAHNAALGAIECAKLEYYRRIIAPYEDIKIKENGDIKAFKNG